MELLFKELLIGVTSFFRDPAAWEQLQGEAIPALLAARPAGGVLRAWSAGCSTGEEAYSLAIAFKEALEQVKPRENFKLQIFATDLDRDAIDKARQGFYPANIAADVSPERLRRFFIKEENGYRVGKEIREMVTFATQNLIMDPPFTKLDILICRNLLIYLTPELQKKAPAALSLQPEPGRRPVSGERGDHQHLHRSLRAAEQQVETLPAARIRPARPNRSRFRHHLPRAQPGAHKELMMPKPAANLQSLADQLLLQRFSPPAVLVNDKGDILYISGRTGKYLEPAAGKANLNIFAMAREGLRFDLGSAFQKAVRQKEAITVKGSRSGRTAARRSSISPSRSIEEPEALRGMVMIVFNDVATPPEKKAPGRSRTAACRQRQGSGTGAGTPAVAAKRFRLPARRCNPPRKSSNPPTRNCSPPTKNCSPPTRS